MASSEIRHLVGIKASPEKVYAALTNTKLLAKWWTTDVRGSADKGGTLEFWFEDNCSILKVMDARKNKTVSWKPVDGYGFEGTKMTFSLEKGKGETFVRFKHSGWKKADFMYDFCSTKWALFMISLKDYLEKGKGHPFPRDVHVMHQMVN